MAFYFQVIAVYHLESLDDVETSKVSTNSMVANSCITYLKFLVKSTKLEEPSRYINVFIQ